MSGDVRTLLLGAAAISGILLFGKVVPRVITSQHVISSQLRAAHDELVRDTQVVADRDAVLKAIERTTTAFLGLSSAFLKGNSANQAAAGLSAEVADAAEANGVHLSALEPGADSTTQALIVPVVVHATGTGDAAGVIGMLRYLEGGMPLANVLQLTVAQFEPSAPSSHMETLRVDFTVRAMYRRVPGMADDGEER